MVLIVALTVAGAACSGDGAVQTTTQSTGYDDPAWHQCETIASGSMNELGTGEIELTLSEDTFVLEGAEAYQDSCRPEIFVSSGVTRDRDTLDPGDPWLHTLRFWYDTISGEARLFDSNLYLVPAEGEETPSYSQSTFDDEGWDLAVTVETYEEGRIVGSFAGGLYRADLRSRLDVSGSFDLHPVRFIIPDEGDDTG